MVFGGAGWIGHKIALQFAGAGHQVTICSRGGKKNFAAAVAHIEHFHTDKHSDIEMEKIFATRRYDIVVDSVPHENTIKGIFKYARGLKHYIHCSSTGGYAPLPFIPCNETAYYEGFDGYWKTGKKAFDNLALELCNREGFPATVLRPCYISGPGMLPLDNLGGRRTDFISDIMKNVPLDVVNDGQALLQPIHPDDLARSFLLASQVPRKCIGQVYNICLERAVTLDRYLEITAGAFDTKPIINHMPICEMLKKHEGHINEIGLRFLSNHMCFDITKAREQLGYVPQHTTEETIEENALWAAETNNLK